MPEGNIATLTAIQRQLLERVDADRDRFVETFRGFIQVPSIYKDLAALRRASEFIADTLTTAGVPGSLVESGSPGKVSVLARLAGVRPERGRSLILNGHMDIYPPAKAWTMDPYSGIVRQGRIYGQGTDDMKAGILAMTLAVGTLSKMGVKLCGDLYLHAIPNHYNGGDGTRTALDDGLRADYAIVGEPSDLKIAVAQNGILYVNVKVSGIPTHVTSQSLGIHPIPHAARLIEALRAIQFPPPHTDPHGGACHLNISALHAEGAHRSLVPEECTFTGDIRFTPSLGRDGAYSAVEQVIERFAATERQLKIELAVDPTCIRNPRNATSVPQDAAITRILAKAIERVLGRSAETICHPAWPDTPVFNDNGVQAVTFGPGSTACYWPDEYVEVDDFIAAIKIYALTALDACGVD
jgi:acetylornithine deacetylase/succinyl-diaminopimelate desuccinylase-like protein